jgi:hypothetical protein
VKVNITVTNGLLKLLGDLFNFHQLKCMNFTNIGPALMSHYKMALHPHRDMHGKL